MYAREKLSTLVDFPVSSLDMSDFVVGGGCNEDLKYDLYGVVDHMGSLGGGHYTAACLSSTSDGDGRWYNFNDRHVHAMYPDRIVSRNAYLLFYRRRKPSAHNLVNFG